LSIGEADFSPAGAILGRIKPLLSPMALEHYSVVTSVYQIVSIFVEAGIVVMLLWRRAALGKIAA